MISSEFNNLIGAKDPALQGPGFPVQICPNATVQDLRRLQPIAKVRFRFQHEPHHPQHRGEYTNLLMVSSNEFLRSFRFNLHTLIYSCHLL